jgi:hypothetical protein
MASCSLAHARRAAEVSSLQMHWLAALYTNIEATWLVFSFILSSSPPPPQAGFRPIPVTLCLALVLSARAHEELQVGGGGGSGEGSRREQQQQRRWRWGHPRHAPPRPPLLLPPGPRPAACAVAKVLPCWVPVLVLFAMRGPSGIRPLKPLYFPRSCSIKEVAVCGFMGSLLVGFVCVFWQVG